MGSSNATRGRKSVVSLQEHLHSVLTVHGPELSSMQGLTGYGVGLDAESNVSIIIFCDRLKADSKAAILKMLAGEPVTFEETGPISPNTDSPAGCGS